MVLFRQGSGQVAATRGIRKLYHPVMMTSQLSILSLFCFFFASFYVSHVNEVQVFHVESNS